MKSTIISISVFLIFSIFILPTLSNAIIFTEWEEEKEEELEKEYKLTSEVFITEGTSSGIFFNNLEVESILLKDSAEINDIIVSLIFKNRFVAENAANLVEISKNIYILYDEIFLPLTMINNIKRWEGHHDYEGERVIADYTKVYLQVDESPGLDALREYINSDNPEKRIDILTSKR
ncbi:hypothetical protein ACFL24_00495 [Patescibacteria group bacterium]